MNLPRMLLALQCLKCLKEEFTLAIQQQDDIKVEVIIERIISLYSGIDNDVYKLIKRKALEPTITMDVLEEWKKLKVS